MNSRLWPPVLIAVAVVIVASLTWQDEAEHDREKAKPVEIWITLPGQVEDADTPDGARDEALTLEKKEVESTYQGQRSARSAEPVDSTTNETGEKLINIGIPMHPEDPATWSLGLSDVEINIGEPMDPDDPTTWPVAVDSIVINVGEPMDPDDPETWKPNQSTEVISVGEYMDPDDPESWPYQGSDEVINIGEPLNPDEAFP